MSAEDFGLRALMKCADVADVLAVSVDQVDRLRREGELLGVKVGQRSYRYEPAEVAEYIRRRRG